MAARSTEPFLIIGGGLIGLSIAHELAAAGESVIVLSRRRSEAAGFVAAGMLAPHAEGLEAEMLELGQLSLTKQAQWVEKIEKNSGLSCGLRKCGIVVPFENLSKRDSYPTCNYGELLDEKELFLELPEISKNWRGGILFKQDGQIDNRRLLMRALEKACYELGVEFEEGVEVFEIITSFDTFKGVRVKDAEGTIKSINSNAGVLCSGAWTTQLLKEIPVFPVKGQMLSIQGPRDALSRIVFGPGTYLVPREDGLIIVGATSEREAGFEKGLTPFGQSQLRRGFESIVPAAKDWPHMERWWGFRPCTPDEKPILGNSPLKQLWVATGHYRNGVLLAAITAELLSKSILGKKLDDQLSELKKSFLWNRFN